MVAVKLGIWTALQTFSLFFVLRAKVVFIWAIVPVSIPLFRVLFVTYFLFRVFSKHPTFHRVFVGGISSTTTEAELHQLFSAFGNVKQTKIIQVKHFVIIFVFSLVLVFCISIGKAFCICICQCQADGDHSSEPFCIL